MRNIAFRCWLQLLLCCLGTAAFSQGLHRYPLRVYSTSEGLSQSSVYHILKDKKGYIWAGTGDGLNRLTPHSVQVFKHNLHDSSGLLANAVRGLVEDPAGNIWIGTDKGLNLYHAVVDRLQTRFHGIPLPNGAACVPIGIFEDKLVGLKQGEGFFSIHLKTGAISRWYEFPQLFRADAACVELYQNLLLAILYDGRLLVLDLQSGESKIMDAPPGEAANLVQIGPVMNGKIYALAGADIYSLALREWQWEKMAGFSSKLLSLGIVNEKELWVNELGVGLHRLDLTGSPLEPVVPSLKIAGKESLDLNAVYCIHQTDDGMVWLGVEGAGALSLRPHTTFQWITKDDPYFPGLTNSFIRSIEVTAENELLAGTYLGGVFSIDLSNRAIRQVKFPPQVGEDVSALLQWQEDTLITSSEKGVWMLYSRNGNVYDQAKLISAPPARKLLRIKKNLLMAGENGILSTDFYESPKRIFQGNCSDILQWKDEVIGASTSGILVFDSDFKLRKEGGKEAAAYGIKMLHISRENECWAATENGLLQLDTATFEILGHRGTAGGLPDNFIYGLLEGGGQLWGSTNRGIFALDPSSGFIRQFTRKDGLQANEFNSGCFAQMPDGQMVFGGVNGLNVFDPVAVSHVSSIEVPLQLNKLWLNDQERPFSYLQNTLQSSERNFSFEWDVLDWADPDRSYVACRLQGLDTGWIELDSRRSIRYTALPPGHYKLWAKAGNHNSGGGEEQLFASFSIAPPFYRAWWFVGLMSVFAALLFGSFIYYTSTRRYRKRLAELERQKEMDQLRKRISRDIHDDVGSDLSKIMMLSRKMGQGGREANRLEQLAQHALHGLSEVVWTVNADYDRLPDMIAWFRAYAYDFFENSDVAVSFESPAAVPQFLIEPDLRRHLLMIFKESLHNVLKHSGAGKLEISFECSHSGSFRLTVQDDGQGFCRDRQNCGNGLRNMDQRAAAAGLKLRINTSRESGTQVTVEGFLHKKYH